MIEMLGKLWKREVKYRLNVKFPETSAASSDPDGGSRAAGCEAAWENFGGGGAMRLKEGNGSGGKEEVNSLNQASLKNAEIWIKNTGILPARLCMKGKSATPYTADTFYRKNTEKALEVYPTRLGTRPRDRRSFFWTL